MTCTIPKGGGGERSIKDIKRKANSLSRDTRQANALGLEGGPPPLGGGGERLIKDLKRNANSLVLVFSVHKRHKKVELILDELIQKVSNNTKSKHQR